jgi:hypothetical protein
VRCKEVPDDIPPSGADFLLSDPILKAQFPQCLLYQSLYGRGRVLFLQKWAIRQAPPFLENPCFDPRIQAVRSGLFSVVSDCLYGTTFHCLLAHGFLFWRFGLLVEVRVTAIIVALEICGSGFPA